MSDLKEKLAQANQKAENQKAERRARAVKGSHLTETFVKLAEEAGCDVRQNTGFHVIVGKAGKGLRIYVAKRGGIVDLLGFTVQDDAVIQITKEVAKAKHMGRVEGRLDLDKSDEAVLAAYRQALDVINVPAPVVEPKPKRERKAKAETAETPVVPEGVNTGTVEAQPAA